MARIILMLSCAAGGLAVALGAFAAHGLEQRLSLQQLETFHTGVEYQMYHALALLGVGILSQQYPGQPLLKLSAILFTLGILLFSGSLYLLSLSGIGQLGMITPLGGIAMLAGWACLFRFGWQLTGAR